MADPPVDRGPTERAVAAFMRTFHAYETDPVIQAETQVWLDSVLRRLAVGNTQDAALAAAVKDRLAAARRPLGGLRDERPGS